MSGTQKILVGKIVAAQGLRGEVRVQAFTEKPEDLAKLNVGADFIRSAGHDIAILKITGVDDRNAAEALRGTELFIARAALPDLPAGEFYHADLIGSKGFRDDEVIGTVAAVHNFGAGDILELDNGEMVSFAGANVDLENKKITLE